MVNLSTNLGIHVSSSNTQYGNTQRKNPSFQAFIENGDTVKILQKGKEGTRDVLRGFFRKNPIGEEKTNSCLEVITKFVHDLQKASNTAPKGIDHSLHVEVSPLADRVDARIVEISGGSLENASSVTVPLLKAEGNVLENLKQNVSSKGPIGIMRDGGQAVIDHIKQLSEQLLSKVA